MVAIKQLARRFRGDRGAELIEMAVATPVLLLIMAGIFDFAMMFRTWEVVTNAAREGARVGVLPGYEDDENVVSRVEEYMKVSGVAGACQPKTLSGGVCPTDGLPCTVCVSAPDVTTTAGTFSARQVTVASSQALPSLSVIGKFFGGNFTNIDVTGTTSMRTEVAGTPAGP